MASELIVGYKEFGGVKAAFLVDGRILVIQRDNKPEIPYPGMWDLVGGGRENNESPLACLTRETSEELGLDITRYKVEWFNTYPSIISSDLVGYFLVIKLNSKEIGKIVFGNEGQGWKLMPIEKFLIDPQVIDHMKERVQDYLTAANI